MTFPWPLFYVSVIVGIFLRFVFPNNTDYMIAATTSGALLGFVYSLLKGNEYE